MENVQKIRWIPDYGKDLELDWLANMHDWMISKKRYWGLALPIFSCECGWFDVIGGKEELKARAVAGWEQFEGHSPHRPWVDAIRIRCGKCGGQVARIPDVGNPWLDAGIVPYSTVRYNSDREYWKKWIPADLVLECFPGQFRNWFYALLSMSTMMENRRRPSDAPRPRLRPRREGRGDEQVRPATPSSSTRGRRRRAWTPCAGSSAARTRATT